MQAALCWLSSANACEEVALLGRARFGVCAALPVVVWAPLHRVGTMQGVQRAAGEALAAEAARLDAHFEALQARIEEAKSQAAAACQPMAREAKVPDPLMHDISQACCWMQSHDV